MLEERVHLVGVLRECFNESDNLLLIDSEIGTDKRVRPSTKEPVVLTRHIYEHVEYLGLPPSLVYLESDTTSMSLQKFRVLIPIGIQ